VYTPYEVELRERRGTCKSKSSHTLWFSVSSEICITSAELGSRRRTRFESCEGTSSTAVREADLELRGTFLIATMYFLLARSEEVLAQRQGAYTPCIVCGLVT